VSNKLFRTTLPSLLRHVLPGARAGNSPSPPAAVAAPGLRATPASTSITGVAGDSSSGSEQVSDSSSGGSSEASDTSSDNSSDNSGGGSASDGGGSGCSGSQGGVKGSVELIELLSHGALAAAAAAEQSGGLLIVRGICLGVTVWHLLRIQG
jgi:hypothetical protein